MASRPASRKSTRKKSSKKKSLKELEGQTDPRAELGWQTFLDAAQPVLKSLKKDLAQRAKSSAAVTAALKARHASEKEQKRTAAGFVQWQGEFIEQVGAAWVLSCVFVRTLEDRGLLNQARIAGPGASDSQKLFFEMAPSLTERDYLLTVFKELSHFPAAAALFDTRHNPVWLLTPSAEAAKSLLALFRTPSADTPAFRFGQADTAFLGWMYQDIDKDVKKRFALLQTPRFVENFILDRTLEPAIEKFGLDDTTLIDPTCGSGHFLLGAFERLTEHRMQKEPGLDVRQAAAKALDAVFGADLNPYAVAIARFRLTLAFLERGAFDKLSDAPALPLHLVVADSLLHNPHAVQGDLADLAAANKDTAWRADGMYALEDDEAARDVLHRKYAAVVGNPPYITVKDKALRERYRDQYPRSAAGKYSVAAPFTERFFQLGKSGARVGMITANSFMKREFGKKLIQEYLPTVNLDAIINTSGAYIPGHGTPTVLLFGSSDVPQGKDVLTVLASRGEPSTPADASKGLVWSSIAEHWNDIGFEDDYITVKRTERPTLAEHPWSLAGGGATELKALLERRGATILGDVTSVVGISCVTGEDAAFLLPHDVAVRLDVGRTKPLITGEFVRDWSLESAGLCLFPYDDDFVVLPPDEAQEAIKFLWPYKNVINRRKRFGTPMLEKGLSWYELQELYDDRLRTPLTITFAFVATHNHFVLDRGGKVFNRTAPIIKLPADASEDDHLALLAYLNSSTACFWMKQVFFDKGGGGIGGGLASAEWEKFYEYDGTKFKTAPIPALDGQQREQAIAFARAAETVAARIQVLESEGRTAEQRDDSTTFAAFVEKIATDDSVREQCFARLAHVQEESDWFFYSVFGFVSAEETAEVPASDARAPVRGSSPATMRYRSSNAPARERSRFLEFTGRVPVEEVGEGGNPSLKNRWQRRRQLIENTPELRMIERPEFKRTFRESWRPVSPKFRIANLIGNDTEAVLADSAKILGLSQLLRLNLQLWANVDGANDQVDSVVTQVLASEDIPYLAALRFKPSGLTKHQEWEDTWDLQRREDAGEDVGDIPVPPKYTSNDFKKAGYYKLRGKLDVPKERFISYPGCESDEDGEPVYGWAGWDHEQRAKALGTLYYKRKTEEGWDKDRLTPMLAGLLELLPWIKQWHGEPSPDYGNDTPANYYEGFLNAECAAHGLTHDDLAAWRP